MRLKVGKSEKIMIFIKMFLSSFLQILMFLDMKLQNKIKFWPKSKRKFKNSSIRTRTGRPKFDNFSSNFSKNLSISMRYTTLPQVGVFMGALIWENQLFAAKNARFSLFLQCMYTHGERVPINLGNSRTSASNSRCSGVDLQYHFNE